MPVRRARTLLERAPTSRGARSIQRILEAAARMFGREGFEGASMNAVARAAGVSKGLLHYHFDSKEHLLIEAVRSTFRQLHARFDDRFRRGETGLETAVDGLEALWEAVRDLKVIAPFMVETLSLATHNDALRRDLDAFYDESTELLTRGIEQVFAASGKRLAIPPERWARLVRINLHGLVIELAYARTDDDLAAIDAAFRDLIALFERVAFEPDPVPTGTQTGVHP